MKKIIVLILFWLVFVVFIVFKSVSQNVTSQNIQATLTTKQEATCGSGPSRSELLRESDYPALRKLGELEEKCLSSATDTLMYFTIMPKDSVVAKQLALDAATAIKEYNKYGIKPLIIVEPSSAWGLIDFTEFENGFYDQWLDSYFKDLVSLGITEDMVEAWVPFPEANLPYWNHQNTQPSDFSKNVNKYLGIMKKYFPHGKGSVLLNSATYPTDDYNWAQGEYNSLKPYVEGLNKDYIDSFGLQGFPWMPPANEKGNAIFEPAEYLNPKLAKEAADIIGTKKIWLNTGTFAAKYTQAQEQRVLVPADIRKQILDKTLNEAYGLKKDGYTVSINLFSQDKSIDTEGTDWSYWGSEFTQNSGHMTSFLSFLKDAKNLGFDVWLFLK